MTEALYMKPGTVRLLKDIITETQATKAKQMGLHQTGKKTP
jgi:hypothetical protein